MDYEELVWKELVWKELVWIESLKSDWSTISPISIKQKLERKTDTHKNIL